eukprot:4185457-Prymnesium_polylepis.1
MSPRAASPGRRGALKPVEPCFSSPGLLIRMGRRVPTLDDPMGKRRGWSAWADSRDMGESDADHDVATWYPRCGIRLGQDGGGALSAP